MFGFVTRAKGKNELWFKSIGEYQTHQLGPKLFVDAGFGLFRMPVCLPVHVSIKDIEKRLNYNAINF